MDKKFLSIKSWAEEDRPREKLLAQGLDALTNTELLAILIATGTQNESAVDIAKRLLLSANNSLYTLGRNELKDLTSIKGIGPAKAITLMAAFELGRRRAAEQKEEFHIIKSSNDVYELLSPLIIDLPYEELRVLYLNTSNKIIGQKTLSKGGLSSTVVDVKIIGKSAFEFLASNIILVHNHPSGNAKPSKHDIDTTHKVAKAAPFFDCKLLDHIIISRNGYYSFADNKLI